MSKSSFYSFLGELRNLPFFSALFLVSLGKYLALLEKMLHYVPKLSANSVCLPFGVEQVAYTEFMRAFLGKTAAGCCHNIKTMSRDSLKSSIELWGTTESGDHFCGFLTMSNTFYIAHSHLIHCLYYKMISATLNQYQGHVLHLKTL